LAVKVATNFLLLSGFDRLAAFSVRNFRTLAAA
jgi:hypothetical protein